jgi:orotate phosphoribosyltransferase
MASKPLTRNQLLKMFRTSKALLRGHFHSGHYFQCAQIMQHPDYAMKIGKEFARRFRSARPTAVVGPAVGGVIISWVTAHALKANAMFCERVDAEMQLRRGFHITKQDRILITEDAITTGESSRKVASLVRSLGAKVVGIGTVVDRSGGRAKFPGYKFVKLFSLAFETFLPHDCPLCSEGIPVTRPGRVRATV